MITEKDIIEQKLSDYYSHIFEKEIIEEISTIGTFKSLPRDEVIINIGDKLTHIPLILNGAIKIISEDQKGKEIKLYFLKKGDTCGLSFINCINTRKSIVKAITEKKTEAIFLPVNKICKWLKKYESWRHFIIESYHMRQIEMVETIDSLTFMKLEDRLYKFLSDEVEIMNDSVLKITHQEIADNLNTSRVVVSRALKHLEKEAKITMRRNRIIVNVD